MSPETVTVNFRTLAARGLIAKLGAGPSPAMGREFAERGGAGVNGQPLATRLGSDIRYFAAGNPVPYWNAATLTVHPAHLFPKWSLRARSTVRRT